MWWLRKFSRPFWKKRRWEETTLVHEEKEIDENNVRIQIYLAANILESFSGTLLKYLCSVLVESYMV
jgi:hypothetical protein